MTARPICVMYFPKYFSFQESGEIVKPLNLMKEFNGWGHDGVYNPRDGIGEYLWFAFFKEGITEPELQVFHEKDFTEIQYAELKELVLSNIKNQTHIP